MAATSIPCPFTLIFSLFLISPFWDCTHLNFVSHAPSFDWSPNRRRGRPQLLLEMNASLRGKSRAFRMLSQPDGMETKRRGQLCRALTNGTHAMRSRVFLTSAKARAFTAQTHSLSYTPHSPGRTGRQRTVDEIPARALKTDCFSVAH